MTVQSKRLALITGASYGIGEALARALALRGYDLFLVARSEERLRSLSQKLAQEHPIRAEWLAMDLAEPEAAQRLYDETSRRGYTIDLLINNAGFGSYGEFARLPLEREVQMIELNVVTLIKLTRLYLPEMLRRGAGTIVNVASTAGFQPVPYMATYAATKAFVLNFSEALWAETRGSGVHVLALCPGPTRTEFQRVAGMAERLQKKPMQTAEEVVETCLRAMGRQDGFVISGWANRLMVAAERLAPRSFIASVAADLMRPRTRA